ncbi:MAG: peptidoglycan DD-metalloendopeptidase family protein [Bacteroidales bacterium]|nr:peptidoglycan DD-metalloendopeptidase family protein [Bacteroidales bacterium]MDD4431731.1 peptidoglycan DD-metalloendopeptidase family protein [Bacteroidales bacterium]
MKQVFRLLSPLILMLMLLLAASACRHNNKADKKPKDTQQATEQELPPEDPARYFLGIRTDTLHMQHGKVPRGGSLSLLLGNMGISPLTIDECAKRAKPVFNVRHLQAGKPYLSLNSKDSINSLKYFIYQENTTDFVVFDFADSLQVYRAQKEISTKTQLAEGEIYHSLWMSMKNRGYNINLALALSDIYAWQLDFFGIQAGDSYRVLYEEQFVDDSVSVGIGKIHGAVFTHAGRDYYAIPFVQDGYRDFFDDRGVNLRKAFLKAPLRYSRISSRYSHSRMHPVLRIRRPHHGVDYAAPAGTPVYSIGAGTVIKKAYQSGGGGNYVSVKHNSSYTSSYMHLRGFAKGLTVGQKVSQGDLLGYVGSTGLSTGPHLDFRVYRNGSPIDPLKMESPPSTPLKPEYKDSFELVKLEIMQQLQPLLANSDTTHTQDVF